MSKELSEKQRQILGLALAIHRIREEQPGERFRLVGGDVDMSIAAHILGGVAIRPRRPMLGPGDDGDPNVWLDTSKQARSARASISRALRLLAERRMLARTKAFAYDLTVTGMKVALLNEPQGIPDLERRLWLLAIKEPDSAPRSWRLKEMLASPTPVGDSQSVQAMR
jgi:hypothetical protein